MMPTNAVHMMTSSPTIALDIGDTQLILEIVCPACTGHQPQLCEKCKGKGVQITQDGARLLAFLKKYVGATDAKRAAK